MKRQLIYFYIIITYVLTWSVEIPVALTKHGYSSINISKVLQTICTLTPGFVAIILTGIFFKNKGLILLIKSLVGWRIKIKWYSIIFVLSVVLCGFSLILFNGTFGKNYELDSAYNFIFYFILILPLSALWEEIGWRGFMLPILLENYSSLKASLIIGFVWGLWHLPIYLAINPYGDRTIIFFLFVFIGCFALSVIFTWLYNSTKGSIFICVLFHNAINTSVAYFYGNLKGNEFRPFIFFTCLLVVSAVGIYFKTKGSLKETEEFA